MRWDMKICLIAEGCYPYVVGGVSSWIHSLILSLPQHEFLLLALVADRSARGKFAYTLPDNVSAVYEVYLNDRDWHWPRREGERHRRQRLSKEDALALRGLLANEQPQWDRLLSMLQRQVSLDDFLMGEDFLEAAKYCYKKRYPDEVFSDFLWTMRSLYLPLFFVMQYKVPKADVYHCVATGYAGILGVMGKKQHKGELLLSEHGIYTREREEELIKAKWVKGIYKDIWIEQFKKLSLLTYREASIVTSLYRQAMSLQRDLGCPPGKMRVTPNGISVESFTDLPGKEPGDEAYVNLGAVLRITPIKDVKTMINAFYYAKREEPRLRLWIMGPWEEDEKYARECFQMVEDMRIQDVFFTGHVDVRQYLGRMDCLILTSISEGQPLTILEGFAAKKPAIATDVGNCRGLIYGEDDGLGEAGIITHIMHIEEISQAMVRMAREEKQRLAMGEIGYRRVMQKYKVEDMRATYAELYGELA